MTRISSRDTLKLVVHWDSPYKYMHHHACDPDVEVSLAGQVHYYRHLVTCEACKQSEYWKMFEAALHICFDGDEGLAFSQTLTNYKGSDDRDV